MPNPPWPRDLDAHVIAMTKSMQAKGLKITISSVAAAAGVRRQDLSSKTGPYPNGRAAVIAAKRQARTAKHGKAVLVPSEIPPEAQSELKRLKSELKTALAQRDAARSALAAMICSQARTDVVPLEEADRRTRLAVREANRLAEERFRPALPPASQDAGMYDDGR